MLMPIVRFVYDTSRVMHVRFNDPNTDVSLSTSASIVWPDTIVFHCTCHAHPLYPPGCDLATCGLGASQNSAAPRT